MGPTGVGKTELAKALAELIFGDENRMQRFDMSEYAEQHAAEKLTGSPPGYVGYEEGGQLTNYVRENPFSLLLFDEIEKADGRVMDKFLQILEDGRLTDSKGQTAYFSQSVIIFTSNIGSDSLPLGDELVSDDAPPYKAIREHYISAVRQHFVSELGRPEILNRFGDNVLVFDLLRPKYVQGICDKFLNSLMESAREKRGLDLRFTEPGVYGMVASAMTEGDNLKFGGRRIRTLLEEHVEKPLNRWVFWNNPTTESVLEVSVSDGGKQLVIRPLEQGASSSSRENDNG
uniref:AAA domain (Cdc48 subfamily) n=1 Tax=Candidatus Kentrum sp. MB TaxID=2138164 RepID=A0A451B9G2_9GAMM|nr:MAG: AAA domain (Cdc48 subfamily) [Candidatus Kentron sp. MB]VFK27090.1 MAG: AAA domain (Cdc48 subfamily) [Candidatus Kentron sp. MB]VFK74911.1 MAG: AAA domain (Cdc48 subfamily) [Candidatus Kentron sp. MB]